jgi:hypothetical protein
MIGFENSGVTQAWSLFVHSTGFAALIHGYGNLLPYLYYHQVVPVQVSVFHRVFKPGPVVDSVQGWGQGFYPGQLYFFLEIKTTSFWFCKINSQQLN